jgi:hypothetical protein
MLYFTACAQETIKTSHDIYNLSKVINHFNIKTRYQVVVASNQCSYEILVNDLPVYQFFYKLSGGPAGDVRPINVCIAKSGKQKLTIKMYPGYDIQNKKFKELLGENAGVKVIIEKDEEEIHTITTPQIDKGQGKIRFTFPEKKYYEENFIFDANVPYELFTLENAQILYTKDSENLKQLEKEVVAKYNQIRDIYITGSKDDLANISFAKEKRFAQQMYYTPEEIRSSWDNDYQFRTDPDLEFFDLKPIENYKMTFYANGKLVCLEKLNNKKSALWGGFKKKDKDIGTTTYIIIYLYRPKGSKTLEIY